MTGSFAIFPAVKSATRKVRTLVFTNGFIQVKSPSCVRGKTVGGVFDVPTNSSDTIEDILEKNPTYVRFVGDLLAAPTIDRLI